MNIRINTYATVTALGADAVVSGGYLYLKGFEPMLVSGIKPTSVIAPVTEQLEVWTGTPTAANSTVYQISLTYSNRNTGAIETWNSVPYTSDATATATEICDNLRAQVNAMNEVIPVVATGTTTLVLTAEAGFAVFTATDMGPGVVAFVNGTAGIPAVGKGSDLKNGNYTDSTLVDASYYYQVTMNYNNRKNIGSAQESTSLVNKSVLYVLSTATNVLTLVGTYGTLTQALAGYSATWTAAGTVPTMSNGVITLGGSDIFYGNSDTNIGLVSGDVINIVKTTATAYNSNYRIASILTGTTCNTPDIPNDLADTATNAWYIKLVKQ